MHSAHLETMTRLPHYSFRWGVARHAQYLFELTAAWSWGILAGVHTHGILPLFYPTFLTILLIHRAVSFTHSQNATCHWSIQSGSLA